jgi:hypothetical protein
MQVTLRMQAYTLDQDGGSLRQREVELPGLKEK